MVQSDHETRISLTEQKMKSLGTTVEDHEMRIRSGEQMKYQLLAFALVGSLIGGAISMAIAVLSVL